jgi:hypothetical protein
MIMDFIDEVSELTKEQWEFLLKYKPMYKITNPTLEAIEILQTSRLYLKSEIIKDLHNPDYDLVRALTLVNNAMTRLACNFHAEVHNN